MPQVLLVTFSGHGVGLLRLYSAHSVQYSDIEPEKAQNKQKRPHHRCAVLRLNRLNNASKWNKVAGQCIANAKFGHVFSSLLYQHPKQYICFRIHYKVVTLYTHCFRPKDHELTQRQRVAHLQALFEGFTSLHSSSLLFSIKLNAHNANRITERAEKNALNCILTSRTTNTAIQVVTLHASAESWTLEPKATQYRVSDRALTTTVKSTSLSQLQQQK